jgi:hypothetical protein
MRGGRKPVKHALPAVKRGIMMERSSHPMSQPVHPQPEHIPDGYALTRRPTRDDREEERAQLRTADGRVMALVERVDPSSLPN